MAAITGPRESRVCNKVEAGVIIVRRFETNVIKRHINHNIIIILLYVINPVMVSVRYQP